jgi:hypothetical protein
MMFFYRLLFFLTILFGIQSLSAQIYPAGLQVNADGQQTEYYDAFVRQDTVYIFGFRGYPYKPSGYDFFKYVVSKFYNDKIVSHTTHVLDSFVEHVVYDNVALNNNSIYLNPQGGGRYFLELDKYGNYKRHLRDTGNSTDENYCEKIIYNKGRLYGRGVRISKVGASSIQFIYSMDTLGKIIKMIDNFPKGRCALYDVYKNYKGNIVVLGSQIKSNCNMALFKAQTRLIELDDTLGIIRDTMESTKRMTPVHAIGEADGSSMVVGSRPDTWFCSLTNIWSNSPYIQYLDSNAKLIWELGFNKRYSAYRGPFDNGTFKRVTKLKDNNYVAVGTICDSVIDSNISTRQNGFVMKFDKNGKILWKKEYRLKKNSVPTTDLSLRQVVELSNKDLICVGLIYLSDSDQVSGAKNSRGWILKLDQNGNLLQTSSEIEEVSKNAIQVYPNPASDWIHISSSVDWRSYSIYSSSGQLLVENKIENSKIYTGHLPVGSYFLNLHTKNGENYHQRFEISR